MSKKFIIALIAGTLALGTTACNTVKGVGKDIQSVGEAGDRAIH
ncbi:MAG: entericidin A/B family lipoprotein [Novosphingobium sp.]